MLGGSVGYRLAAPGVFSELSSPDSDQIPLLSEMTRMCH